MFRDERSRKPPIPEVDEHTHPALLYFLLPFGVVVFILGVVGGVAMFLGGHLVGVIGMGFLAYMGLETARRAWRVIVKKRASAERSG